MSGTVWHDALHAGQTGVHEIAHSKLGLIHDGGFMNQGGNQGAAGLNETFTVAQFVTINKELNKYGILSTTTPFIHITSPINGFTTNTSFRAK